MEAKTFDRLVKRMGGAADRRQLLAGLGAVVAGLLGRPVAAKAPDKPNGTKCTKDAQCRSQHCCRGSGGKHGTCRECCTDGDCGADQLCRDHVCVPDSDICSPGHKCGKHQHCCDGVCQECCDDGDCRGEETCEDGRCVCHGCLSRNNSTCVAGTAWAECGADSERCAVCVRGEICDPGPPTCTACDVALFHRPLVTWCDALHNFAKFQCAPNCTCVSNHGGGAGVCFDRGINGYCSEEEPICHRHQDCVNQGDGDYCVQVGNCADVAHCYLTACVTKCGAREGGGNARAGDSPPQIVVRD